MNSALKFTQATSIILIPTSTMLDPTCGSGSAVRAAEITRGEAFPRYGWTEMLTVPDRGEVRMFDWEKSSGVDAPRKKNFF